MNISDSPKHSTLILVIDDDRLMRIQLRRAMEQEGYQVAEAVDGEEGLAAYTCLKPDIVLVDGIMPVMDGFTCCKLIRSLPGGDRIPILTITALEDEESVDRAFEAGAIDYITKPIHWAVLRQRVRRLLEASHAEQELRQQTERERLIDKIAQRIRQSLNLEKILNTTVAEVREFLQADRVLIYRYDCDGHGSIVVESVGDRWIPILGKKIAYPYLGKNYIPAYQQNRIQAKADIYTLGLPQSLLDLLAGFQVRAHLVVPILQDNSEFLVLNSQLENSTQNSQLWGLLIAHQCSGPRHWQNLEIDLLKQLATQVAIAIQQSELYQHLARLNTDLEKQVQERTDLLQQALNLEAMLKRITDKVRDTLDESHILQTAVQELALGLKADYCCTALYNLEKATSSICSEYAITSPSDRNRVVQMADFPGIYSQLLQGQYLQFCEIASHSIPQVQHRVAVLACPILDNQGVLGDLWLLKPKEYVFNELEIRLVQQVANQCAIAIRQARLYQAAQAQVEELEKLSRLKDDFLNTVSHELKTPVSNMKMAIQMLEVTMNQECGFDPELENTHKNNTAARYFHLLNDECEREINLINDLLELQQLNAGTLLLDRRIIHLQDWIPHVVEPFEHLIHNQQQILEIDIPRQLPPLASDPFSLKRILTELLNNACKYTPAKGKITVGVRINSDKIQLRVSNSGIEIPRHEMHRIFDKFYRIPSNDPWKHGGTGLGLALVDKLVSYLGGSIQVESESRHTTFLVELPIMYEGK
ncbi:GAF domain-containing protein [Aerosakkonema funiforme]|uniref:hybrid sensor histidine kinase/response regulator n=1 Tax=Aerosakkonema funiforme TaxID=1246630 RepID=UPI0035B7BD9E